MLASPNRRPIDSHGVHGLACCATAVTILSILSAGATAEPQRKAVQQSAAESGDTELETITVEAQRLRELERQISTFVSAITIHNRNDSLARWQVPICPLVAGLPFNKGTFVFQRVSQVASETGIPLDSQDCKPNLLVVITREPEVLIRKWWRKQHRLFNQDRGVAAIERTIRTDAPVRVFYNACSVPPGLTTTFAPRVLAQCGSGTLGSKLTRGAVRAIYSVIVVVDAEQIKALDLEPLTDYIALISLAQIRRNSDLGAAPRILRLFDDTGAARLQGLSPWDQAFLKSLYGTDSGSVMQQSQMKRAMARDLAR